jgi:pyruvate dehydrogenase E1 component alpha subunit
VLEFATHRVGPHSKGDDSRPVEQRRHAADHDWYAEYAIAHPEHFADWDDRLRAHVDAVVREVAARPPAGETA